MSTTYVKFKEVHASKLYRDYTFKVSIPNRLVQLTLRVNNVPSKENLDYQRTKGDAAIGEFYVKMINQHLQEAGELLQAALKAELMPRILPCEKTP